MPALLDLVLTAVAGALWYVRPALGPWPLLLVAAGLLARAFARPPLRWRLGPWPACLAELAAPIALFLISAAMGLALAYHADDAAARFWVIVGGIALCGAFVRAPEQVRIGPRELDPLRAALAVLPAAIAAYFLATNDWTSWMGKLPWLDPLMSWLAGWQIDLPGHRLHPNVAGGLIAAFVPLQVAALFARPAASGRPPARAHRGVRTSQTDAAPSIQLPASSFEHRASSIQFPASSFQHPASSFQHRASSFQLPASSFQLLASIALLALSLAGLLLTASRGAWLALAIAAAGWLAWRALARRPLDAIPGGTAPRMRARALAAGALVLLAVALALAAPAAAESERVALLANSLDLARDAPFTGIGLAGFRMAFSSYVLLLHVGHTLHSHNLPLNIWIEQGLPGLIAFIWLLVVAARLARRPSPWRTAAVAAIAVILLHGLVDDAFYGSRGVLLFFVPFALLARAPAPSAADPGRPAARAQQQPPRAGLLRRPRPLALLAVAALLILALLPPVRAAFQANLGALAQTQAELSVYRWPDVPLQDELRRPPGVDLEPALARYRAALALDPGNVTANRRLGQIALSRGERAAARTHLSAAYAVAPGQRATRQLLGETFAVEGRIAEAAALWRTVDVGQGQIPLRTWWYDHIGDPQASAWIAAAAAAE